MAGSKVDNSVVLSVDLMVGLWAESLAALLVEQRVVNLAFLVADYLVEK